MNRAVGLGVMLANVLLSSCGGAGEGTSTNATGGAGNSSASNSTDGGASSNTNGTSGGSPTEYVDPDAAEDCTEDPKTAQWRTMELNVDPTQISLDTGGGVSVVTFIANGELQSITSTDGITWSEPFILSQSPSIGDDTKTVVGRDGLALVLWTEGDGTHARFYGSVGGWQSDTLIETASTDYLDAVLFPGGGALLAWGLFGTTEINHFFCTQGSASEGTPLAGSFFGLFPGADDTAVAYGHVASLTVGSDEDLRYVYTTEGGFATAETLPGQQSAEFYQEAVAEFPNGRAARLVYHIGTSASSGVYATPRSNGQWGIEEVILALEANTMAPTFTSMLGAGNDLVVFGSNNARVTFRTHDGATWAEQAELPRSSSVTLDALDGSTSGTALAIGSLALVTPDVNATKLWRRGEDGTWYCPRLLGGLFAYGPVAAASEDGTLLTALYAQNTLHITEFRP